MTRTQGVLVALGVALLAGGAWWTTRDATGNTSFVSANSILADLPLGTPSAPSLDAFAGEESCRTCHAVQYAAWNVSTHGQAGGRPGLHGDKLETQALRTDRDRHVRVIAPFNGAPLRFSDAVVTPRERDGVFTFLVQRPGERDTTLVVEGVIGGGHMVGGGTQGFMTRWADGTWRFLPFDWSRQGSTWFCHTGTRLNQGWLPITPALRLADCGDWPPTRILGDEPRFTNCQSCHGSQIAVDYDSVAGRWRTQTRGLAINCESCHGPAARHVALMQAGAPPTADVGLVPLATLDTDASLATCLACHALKTRLASRFQPGAELFEFYSLRLSQLGEQPYTADGRTRTFAYQEGHLASACYRDGNMTCTSCHDPHSQRYRTVNGEPLPGRTDDRQCTSCHASKAIDPPAHTRHASASAGSKCVACHMPYQQQPELGHAIRYARSDHTIAIPRPVLDSTLGFTSACRGCHMSKSETQLAQQVATWWGAIKPHETAVEGVLAANGVADLAMAIPLLLRPQSTNATAQVAGLTQLLEQYLLPDMADVPGALEERLRTLASSDDMDVQALALASLHYAQGQVGDTRRFLARRLAERSRSTDALRRRWAMILGTTGDAARSAGDPARAERAYEKALEITPSDPALLVSRGIASAARGQVMTAGTLFERALAIDPLQPLAAVNLGIVLEQGGNVESAQAAFRGAIGMDPSAGLGYLNLATSQLRNGDANSAIPNFEKALAREPGLAVGHFQLALAYLKAGKLILAEASVRRSLALDPTNEEARRLNQALRDAR